MLSKHPQLIPVKWIPSFINSLVGLLKRSKESISTEHWVVQCLLNLCLICQDRKDEIFRNIDVNSDCISAWRSVWELTSNKISIIPKGLQDIYFTLLRSLIQADLVEAYTITTTIDNVWKAPIFNDPERLTLETLSFVHVFLLRHELREDQSNPKSPTPKRDRLMEWIASAALEVSFCKSSF